MKKKSPRPRARRADARKRSAARRPRRETHETAAAVEIQELETLRAEIDRLGKAGPPRWNADPEDVRRSVAKLVLTLVEFVRQLLERQAIRRMDAGTLSPQQTEDVGLALMRLEETIRDLAGRFGLDPDELNLDLGPAGRLM